jgi:hypothetical protein
MTFETSSTDRVAKSPFVAFCLTESEKCHFRFPYKSMTDFTDLCFGPVIDLGAPLGAR